VLSYNEFWYERGIELTADKRTSLVIDPPDGRLPPRVPRTPDPTRERLSREEATARSYDSYENRGTGDRCIMGFNAGPPMRSASYNNNVMIFQSPGYVTILNEMVHNARIIPIGDTASPPFPQYSGVSRGHWAGETLVIETTQFRGGSSGLTSPNMHLIERLTRLDPDTVAYEYTITDPTTYTAPYTVMMPFVPADRWTAVRVRVSRRQHRTLRYSRRGARARAPGERVASLIAWDSNPKQAITLTW